MASPAELHHSVRFGVFELDLRTRELRTKRRKLSLQEQPFLILALLLERPGQLVTREELVKRVWTSDTFVDFDHSLNKAVNRLREVLGDSADNPRFIETLPRRGYRFIAPITGNGSVEPAATVSLSSFPEGTHEWPAGPGSSVSAEEAVSTPSCQIPATSGKRRFMYAITIAVLVVGATGFVIHNSLSHNRVLDLRNMQITKLTDNGRVREIAISPDSGHRVHLGTCNRKVAPFGVDVQANKCNESVDDNRESRNPYDTDLTDAEWNHLEPLYRPLNQAAVPPSTHGGKS